ncbi:unnamed protein product, partial [Polarella glacialis]
AKRLMHHGLSLSSSRVLDVQPWCTEKAGRQPGQPISLTDAVFRQLGGESMDKGSRMTDWEGELSHAQLRYAAIDAWAALRLFALSPVGAIVTTPPPPQPGSEEANSRDRKRKWRGWQT